MDSQGRLGADVFGVTSKALKAGPHCCFIPSSTSTEPSPQRGPPVSPPLNSAPESVPGR
jgi:hypothetical protein